MTFGMLDDKKLIFGRSSSQREILVFCRNNRFGVGEAV